MGYSRSKDRKDLYRCGDCLSTFDTICVLHKHLLTKEQTTSYFYDISSKTAHPHFGKSCQATQTESEMTLDSLVTFDIAKTIIKDEKQFEDLDINYSLDDKDDKSRSTEDFDEIIRMFDIDDTYIQTSDTTEDEIAQQQENYRNSYPEDNVCAHIHEENSNLTIGQKSTSKCMYVSSKRKRKTVKKGGNLGYHRKFNSEKTSNNGKPNKLHIQKVGKSQRTMSLPHVVDDQFPCKRRIKNYKCDICCSNFTSQSGARRHFLIHTGQLQYSCDLCEKKYPTLSELNLHQTTHSDQKNKMCQFCGELFSNASILRQHIKICQNIRPFICSKGDCGKSFIHKNSLLMHERNHTGETPYICEVCGCGFKRADSLTKHMSSHTGIRPWMCRSCPKSFNSKYHLQRHELTHTGRLPYVCHCGKSFTQKWNLKAHMRQHTGEKPYVCEICWAEFTHNVSKKTHMKLHEDGKSIPLI